MPSSSSLISSLNNSKTYYVKSSHHATYNFNQAARALYRNQPRFPFEYYININLNNITTATEFISGFFNNADLSQLMPLVKTVEMPAFKIESTPLNQYNRKRISQTKIAFEPIKMVFHDVVDGKTLAFWDMYYRYYFSDGNEPGKNQLKDVPYHAGSYSVEQTNTAGAGGGQSTPQFSAHDPRRINNGNPPISATNTNGDKSAIQNIISDTLDNHNFGFNIDNVQNVRNLIQTIDIYQVHGGRFNQVTLVNPRIVAFTHDTLNYAASDKTLEITFTWEYEYAYYTIQNMQLTDAVRGTGGEPNNSSSMEPFMHGDYYELSNLSFTSFDPDFIDSPNPSAPGDTPINVGSNVQAGLGAIEGPYAPTANSAPTPGSSSLSGVIDISPQPANPAATPVIETRSFGSSAVPDSTAYPDMNRASGV